MPDRAADHYQPIRNHGGATINVHYIAANYEHDAVYFDQRTFDDVNESLANDYYGADDDLAPLQRSLDNLVRCALDFGTTGSNHLWTHGIDDYDVTNLHSNDKARAAAALNAALDFAKAVGAARHKVREP